RARRLGSAVCRPPLGLEAARRGAGLAHQLGAQRPPRCYARSTAFVPASGCRQQYRKWAHARFFYVEAEHMTSPQAQIEARLADREPDVEVLLAEVVGGTRLRVFIDHPEGVTLALCERVTMLLNDMRETYSLEV